MKNRYKLQYTKQIQTLEDGRKHEHNKITTTLPADFVKDLGLDKNDNLIDILYDKHSKTILIRKAE